MGKKSSKAKKARSERVNLFLLDIYFSESKNISNDVRQVGRWVLVKMTDGISGKPMVAIYTQESYAKHREYTRSQEAASLL